MATPALAVLTFKSVEEILESGGTQSWALKPENAARYSYVVCARNLRRPGEGHEDHGAAFLIGVISGVVPATGKEDRFKILISKYAIINVPGAWKGWRNPVRYTTLEELGVDLSDIEFRPLPSASREDDDLPLAPRRLTIAEAKEGLALTFGVSAEAIEITIRG